MHSVYYSERIIRQLAKGKCAQEAAQRKAAHISKTCLPVVTQCVLNSPSNGLLTTRVVNQGCIRNSLPRDFTWKWSCRYHLSKFQTPRRKVGIQQKPVSTNSLGIVSHFYCLGIYISAGNCFPDASQVSTLQAGTFKHRGLRPVMLTILHSYHNNFPLLFSFWIFWLCLPMGIQKRSYNKESSDE